MMRVAGVLLAAGGSRRLGSPKQLLKVNGVTLVERAAQQLLDAGCDPVVVVTGAYAEQVGDAVAMLPVVCCENVDWELGMGTSIAAAIRIVNGVQVGGLGADGVEAVLIATCDMPSVSVEHLRALLSAAAGGHRVASEYAAPGGAPVRGIPAVLPRADFPELEGLSGDQGARGMLRNDLTLTVSLRQGNFDLDTPDDVAEWRASLDSE